jgi:hypothetical protein
MRDHSRDTGAQETPISQSRLSQKVQRAEVEQIKRIIMGPIEHAQFIRIRGPAPNQKRITDTRAGVSKTWTGSLSAGLQECRGEIARREHKEIVAWGVVDNTSEEDQFAGGSGSRGKGMTISGKRRWRRPTILTEGQKVQPVFRPWVDRPGLSLLLRGVRLQFGGK